MAKQRQSAVTFFKQLLRDLPATEHEVRTIIIKVEAENQFARNFRNEGFETTTGNFDKWKKRKDNEDDRALLVKSGRLKELATHGTVIGDKVVFNIPLKYARIHNEGSNATIAQSVRAHDRATTHYYERSKYRIGKTHKVAAHTRQITQNMPKRQYIGDSEALDDRIQAKLHKYFTKKLKAQ